MNVSNPNDRALSVSFCISKPQVSRLFMRFCQISEPRFTRDRLVDEARCFFEADRGYLC